MATIRDVAKRAGVAPSSVTRVLANHPNVRPELRERVLAAIDEVGYEPDLVAAALRGGKSRTVGVLVSDVVNPTIAAMVDALEIEFRAAGYGVLLSSSRGDPARDIEGLALLRQRRIDGLVVAVADETNPEVLAELRRMTFPVVLMDRQVDDSAMSRVLSDHYGGTRRLVEHLADSGHERIALVNGPSRSFPTRERVRGWTTVLDERGLPHEGLLRAGPATHRFGADVVGAFLDAPQPPTALVVGNATTLVGILRELARREIAVGQDLAVAAGDDSFVTTLSTPMITAMSRDLAEVGRQAATMLVAHMADPGRMPHTIVLPTGVDVRGSTAMTPAAPARGRG